MPQANAPENQASSKCMLVEELGTKRKVRCRHAVLHLSVHDLSWVHEPVRVQCTLDASHHIDGIETEFLLQRCLLPQPDTMLAGACALHLKRTVDHVMDALFDSRSLLGVFTVVHDTFVEVAVSDMTQDAGEETEVVHLLLGDFYEHVSN
jgi:hypothetical protein